MDQRPPAERSGAAAGPAGISARDGKNERAAGRKGRRAGRRENAIEPGAAALGTTIRDGNPRDAIPGRQAGARTWQLEGAGGAAAIAASSSRSPEPRGTRAPARPDG